MNSISTWISIEKILKPKFKPTKINYTQGYGECIILGIHSDKFSKRIITLSKDYKKELSNIQSSNSVKFISELKEIKKTISFSKSQLPTLKSIKKKYHFDSIQRINPTYTEYVPDVHHAIVECFEEYMQFLNLLLTNTDSILLYLSKLKSKKLSYNIDTNKYSLEISLIHKLLKYHGFINCNLTLFRRVIQTNKSKDFIDWKLSYPSLHKFITLLTNKFSNPKPRNKLKITVNAFTMNGKAIKYNSLKTKEKPKEHFKNLNKIFSQLPTRKK